MAVVLYFALKLSEAPCRSCDLVQPEEKRIGIATSCHSDRLLKTFLNCRVETHLLGLVCAEVLWMLPVDHSRLVYILSEDDVDHVHGEDLLGLSGDVDYD